jgi:aconitate hydratase
MIKNITRNKDIKVNIAFSDRQIEMILAGGLLNYTKNMN